jgi:hypothetical protein
LNYSFIITLSKNGNLNKEIMGKRKGHRGKAGGRLRFLRALKKELNTVKNFDPSKFWSEEVPAVENRETKPTPPRNLLLEIQDFRLRAAKAHSIFTPRRIRMRPAPMNIYTQKPAAKQTLPRILSNIKINIKMRIVK